MNANLPLSVCELLQGPLVLVIKILSVTLIRVTSNDLLGN